MTTFGTETINCPCCGESFEIQLLTSTNTFGVRTTDLYVGAGGFQPILIVIACCPTCGYSSEGYTLREADPVEPAIKEKVFAELKPQVADGVPPPAGQWAFAAQIAEWRGEPDMAVADAWLRAAWAAAQSARTPPEQEAAYRRQAITFFQRALQADPPPDNALILTYLVGELYRRVGHTEQAEAWFNEAITMAEHASQPDASQLADLARQQRDAPKETL
ncbi:MAG: DUF2225 domain-containing protein [Anaerolineae bacterium]